MQLRPLFQASATKPKAQLSNNSLIGPHLLRNNFTITTWLLLGAMLQALLILLPIRTTFAIGPVFVLLLWQIVDNLLMVVGITQNRYMNGVIIGKHSAVFPGQDGSFEREDGTGGPGGPGGDEITVVLLTARCNHPLGLFADGLRKSADYMADMNKDLEEHAEEYGWLGGTSWLNTGDRSTASEIMSVHYFKSREHLHKFSHEKAHRLGWDWYNSFAKTNKYLAFNHEVYSAPAGRWENIYLNNARSGIGTTSHSFKDKDGKTKWISPVVDASRGKLRSSAGRMGLDDGSGNAKYTDEPYEEIDVLKL